MRRKKSTPKKKKLIKGDEKINICLCVMRNWWVRTLRVTGRKDCWRTENLGAEGAAWWCWEELLLWMSLLVKVGLMSLVAEPGGSAWAELFSGRLVMAGMFDVIEVSCWGGIIGGLLLWFEILRIWLFWCVWRRRWREVEEWKKEITWEGRGESDL